MSANARFEDYRFEIRPLSEEDGGGFLVSFPDLPGCISDGETYEEALANARDAFAAWIAAHEEEGREIPSPNGEGRPAKFVLRLPRSLHERLGAAAASDGTSANTLVTMFVAEGLARRERPTSSPVVEQAGEVSSTEAASPATSARVTAAAKSGIFGHPKGSTTAVASRSTIIRVLGGTAFATTLATPVKATTSSASVSDAADPVVVSIHRVRR
jgi:antitoxin HicB